MESPNAAGGAVTGTGPFRVTEWQPGKADARSRRIQAGRPFMDAIEIGDGQERDQLIALELGKGRMCGGLRRSRGITYPARGVIVFLTSSPMELAPGALPEIANPRKMANSAMPCAEH